MQKYYNAKEVPAFSIPASEHSSIITWGIKNESLAYKNMLDQFAKSNSLVACVSDSYNIMEACKIWGTELKQQIIDSGAMLVVRPDSGIPNKVVLEVLIALDKYFGSTINSKGYKVLNHVRVIQGDGIDEVSIRKILSTITEAKYSTDNVAFGMGGALLQKCNRDTLSFAMKSSAICANREWRDVQKLTIEI